MGSGNSSSQLMFPSSGSPTEVPINVTASGSQDGIYEFQVNSYSTYLVFMCVCDYHTFKS